MRVINFLPDDYRQRISARRANLVCILLGVGTLLALGGGVAYVYFSARGTANLRAMVQRQYDEANRQVDQANQLEDRKSGLLHKVELSTALLERVPSSRLLAVMVNCLPQEVSLTGVTMRVEEVDVKPADPKKAGEAPKAKTLGDRNAAPAAPTKVKRVVFRLDGLAQTDVQVAEYLTRLAADPLFEDPDLQYSETFPYEEGIVMRRFQLTFRLSPRAEQIMDMTTVSGKLTAAPAADAGKGAS